MYEVIIEKKFSSAHFLRNYHGKDEDLHGHNWKVQIKFRGPKLVQPEEYLVDFAEAHQALENVLKKIGYKNINEIPPFTRLNPSAENIARWICEEIRTVFPAFPPHSVTVWETEDGAATFFPVEP